MPADPARCTGRGPEPCILIVTGQHETLTSTKCLLEAEGYQVRAAASGGDAIQILQANEIRVIVVDYRLMDMTGPELIDRVRAFDPYVQIVLQAGGCADEPPREVLESLDIQGHHDSGDAPERLLTWIRLALRADTRLRTLQARAQAHTELVANCSHEFRTPLNIIVGYVDLLLGETWGELPEEANATLRSVLDTTRGLAELVEDFLSFVKVESGVESVTASRIRVEDVVRELARLGTVLTTDRPVTFETDIELAPRFVSSDPVKLRTILRNLVVNAAKFTKEGHIKLRVYERSRSVVFEVSDTGCGIAPENLGSVFEPFQQLGDPVDPGRGGVGLGLTLGRKLARLLHGHLRVSSAPGEGTTFSLHLPVELPAGVDATAANPEAPAGLGERSS